MPRQPLPPGFLQRLERRRAGAEAASAAWLPLPARALAFAASSLIVIFVVYDRVKVLFPVTMSPAQSMISGAASDLRVDQPARSLAGGGGLSTGPAKRQSAPRGFGGGASFETAAAGAPVGEPLPKASLHTNESLHAAQERERAELGIQKTAPPEPRYAMGTLAGVRGGAIDGSGLEERLRRLAVPPAPIAGGTPGLLAAQPPAETPASAESDAAALFAEGVVLRSEEERGALWQGRGLKASPPTVDFSAKILVLVFSPNPASAVEIDSVWPRPNQVVVRYRLLPLPAESVKNDAPPIYQYRLIPKTDLPVVFERLP